MATFDDQSTFDGGSSSTPTSPISNLIRPATFTFADAISRIGGPRALADRETMYAVNVALYDLWNAADWRETIALLPPFYLYPTEQIYGRPSASVPSDFHGLREVYCVSLLSDTTNRWPLNVVQNIEITHLRDWPRDICFDPSNQAFRIHPRTPDGLGSGSYVIDGTYKRRAPKILAEAYNTLLPWDDEYFDVYTNALAWAMAKGQGKKSFYSDYQLSLDSMRDAESLNLGDESISPSDALVNPFWRI